MDCIHRKYQNKVNVWAHKSSQTLPLFLSAYTNPGMRAIMYMCVRCIHFASVYYFSIGF